MTEQDVVCIRKEVSTQVGQCNQDIKLFFACKSRELRSSRNVTLVNLNDVRSEFQECSDVLELIQSCVKENNLHKGREIHADVLNAGLLNKSIFIGNALISMYAKCGALAMAQELFDELPTRNVVSWTALIHGYGDHDLGDEALKCFQWMQHEGFSPNAVTYICLLKSCGSIGAAEKGEAIHAEVSKLGLLGEDIVLGNSLISMYAKCGAVDRAQEVFDDLPTHDVVSWNALVSGYAEHGLGYEALTCFKWMHFEGLTPNSVTFISILKACGTIGEAEKGEKILAEVSNQGLFGKNILLTTALVDMYVKCGALGKAQEVFDRLPMQNAISWNTLLAGYAEEGFGDGAMKCFKLMQEQGVLPNAITFVCFLKACSSLGTLDKGESIHCRVGNTCVLKKNITFGTALVDMYAKCGSLTKAQEVFDELEIHNSISWNSLISGYAEHGHNDKVLKCFEDMQREGFSPDDVTFLCIVKACGSMGAAKKGQRIYAEMKKQDSLRKDLVLTTALVDMYAKCGELMKAQEVFDELPTCSAASWTVLIAGYARLGKVKRLLDLFYRMRGENIEPNEITFTVVLTACSHSGLVEDGLVYFESISSIYSIILTSDHCTCVVDLLSRAGHFEKALSVIERVPASNQWGLWIILLGACRKWVDVELGKCAFKHVIDLDEKHGATYVCMSNLYDAGMHEEAQGIEALSMGHRARDMMGQHWQPCAWN